MAVLFCANRSPSSKDYLGRSPVGTAMLAALSRKHIARLAGLGRPGARPDEGTTAATRADGIQHDRTRHCRPRLPARRLHRRGGGWRRAGPRAGLVRHLPERRAGHAAGHEQGRVRLGHGLGHAAVCEARGPALAPADAGRRAGRPGQLRRRLGSDAGQPRRPAQGPAAGAAGRAGPYAGQEGPRPRAQSALHGPRRGRGGRRHRAGRGLLRRLLRARYGQLLRLPVRARRPRPS